MKRNIVTISDNGTVNVPANVQMRDFEIAELFEVMAPTIRSNIRAILKSGAVTADAQGGVQSWAIPFTPIITGWIWWWLLPFGFNHGRRRFSEIGY